MMAPASPAHDGAMAEADLSNLITRAAAMRLTISAPRSPRVHPCLEVDSVQRVADREPLRQ